MKDVIDRLLARGDIDTTEPASWSEIAAVSGQFGVTLPHALVKLWYESNGVTLQSLRARLLGPSEIRQLTDKRGWKDRLGARQYLPILDDHQSNYLVVAMRDPLAFRIVHTPHDDASHLLYRDFESCIGDMHRAMDSGQTADIYLYHDHGDYGPDAPRPREDQEAARELMRTSGERNEWNYAAQLLDASNLEEFARLLETDHFVRRDVRARMQKMTSPAIRQLLRKDAQAFEVFADVAADAARNARLKVGRRDDVNLQIDGKWINLEAFFYRRNIPNAMQRMIWWIEDLAAGRNPYQRPGHFQMD